MSGILRNIVLALSDAICVLLSWGFALWGYWAIGGARYRGGSIEPYFRFWPVMVAFVVINSVFRLYHGKFFHPGAPLNPVEELRRLVGSSLVVHIGAVAVLALTYQTTEGYSRAVIAIAGLIVAVLVQPMRDFARHLMKDLDFVRIPVRLIGEKDVVDALARTFAADAHLGFKVVESAADMAVVCGDLGSIDIAALVAEYGHVEFLPTGGVLPTYGAQPVSFDGWGGIEIVNQRKIRLLRVEKWIVDKLLAVLVFLLTLPLFILIPLAIKLTSRGSVFYRHHRLGRDGKAMEVWKFRSMYADADERLRRVLAEDRKLKSEWEKSFKLADDPRVTPLGRLLRKTSLDELPQLFNVFAGDMALVGPRPIVEAEVSRYGDFYETFASVRPGITGLWQCSGRSDVGYARRVALDVHYVLNWSPWMDLWILRRTMSVVLTGKGAK